MKLTTAAEAVKEIRDGDKVFTSGASSTPDALMDALFDTAVAGEVRGLRMGVVIALAPVYKVLQPELQKNILMDNYYATPLDQQALQDGLMVHTPFHFSEFARQATRCSGYNIGFFAVRAHGQERLDQLRTGGQLHRYYGGPARSLPVGEQPLTEDPRPELRACIPGP